MCNKLLKLVFPIVFSILLISCSDSQKSKAENKKEHTGKESKISIAMMQPPRTGLSPLSDDAFKLSRWSTAETLVKLNEKSDAVPMLATQWDQIDPLTWHFNIRKGVKFHDGSELNANTVANSLQKALDAAPKPRILDGIEWKINVIDDSTVEIKTTFNDPLLPSRLSSPQLSILSSKAYKDDGRVIPINAGTGPFVLTNINGQTSAKLKRFDKYWGEKAKINEVFVEYVPNGFARAAALRTDKADIVETVPVSQIAMIDSSKLHEVAMPRTNTLYLNNKSKVFKNINIRKAATEAVKREQIINIVYENHADLAKGLLGHALKWAEPIREQNPRVDNVKEGRVNGDRITIGTFTDRAELPEVAVLLKQQLEAVGFVVDLDIREYAQIENDALAGKFDAFLLSRATVLDSGDPVAYMQSDFGCNGSFNLGQFCSKDVDTALAYADSQPLGKLRQQAIIEAENKILEQYAAIPLLHERIIQGENSRIKNVQRDPRERRLIDQFTEVNS
ncbi:ABC transporter substrate-binding protein [Francisella adeliensis]|uniref:ABC transporter substrate-binding protein n=1 Tax=Francisella adeliensis TaxID=2007306 RepID=A0A2Z4XYD4_9GAMM|nr:ABC transporter substrate-binding protein [Francisella adeliensis]AXA33891.1 ABC transporter substrate-binding protein [Francisella adeliensis]MBK2085793.1 ABC transporter substrate-binding protein [Francisella adeliensis]MBK2097671.1 ABC transporter substrate-binding protein [Francisella adeliensis]QIW12127.1 ABC transporter substrate-binding protein [Francisella adeliensis]QIW14001.1 ABC transporter substrate-binding protein [Francisella adeliensis]